MVLARTKSAKAKRAASCAMQLQHRSPPFEFAPANKRATSHHPKACRSLKLIYACTTLQRTGPFFLMLLAFSWTGASCLRHESGVLFSPTFFGPGEGSSITRSLHPKKHIWLAPTPQLGVDMNATPRPPVSLASGRDHQILLAPAWTVAQQWLEQLARAGHVCAAFFFMAQGNHPHLNASERPNRTTNSFTRAATTSHHPSCLHVCSSN